MRGPTGEAILAIEPNGRPAPGFEFIGAPDYFKEGKLALTYGITSVPITYAPALDNPADLKFVEEDKPDGPGLATCWKQAEPARQRFTRLKMPDHGADVRGVVSRALRPLHREVSCSRPA